MQSNGANSFIFSPNFNFGNDSVFNLKNSDQGTPFPPSTGLFLLLRGDKMELLDGTDFLLL